MEREIIERLAMDQSLGELDVDTAALLEAYLAEHGQARRWARAMAQTCTRTREAISQKAPPIEKGRPVPRPRPSWPGAVAWRTVGHWAAVVLVSLSLGAVAGRRFGPQVSTPKTVVVQAESPSAHDGWRRVMSEPVQGFWETKAVAMLQTKSEEIPRVHPGHRGLWDRYRQRRKGRSYE